MQQQKEHMEQTFDPVRDEVDAHNRSMEKAAEARRKREAREAKPKEPLPDDPNFVSFYEELVSLGTEEQTARSAADLYVVKRKRLKGAPYEGMLISDLREQMLLTWAPDQPQGPNLTET